MNFSIFISSNCFHETFVQMSARRQLGQPKRRNSDRRVASLITNQLATIIPTLVNQITQSNSGSSQANSGPPPCTFKHFHSCNPSKFTGGEGATRLPQWFESMENTFIVSDCPDNLRVRYATSVLQKRALTWWNGEKRKKGAEVAMALTWEEVKEMMVREFCPRNEMKKLEDEFWKLEQDSSLHHPFSRVEPFDPSYGHTPIQGHREVH